MAVKEIADWLKSSVPGIILLGTLGSLVAALALNVARRLLLEFLPARYRSLRAFLTRDQYLDGYILGALAAKQDIGSHLAYFAFVFAKFVIGLVAGLFFATAFLFQRYSQGIELTGLSYSTLVLSFLGLAYAAFSIRPIVRGYIYVIPQIVEHGRRAFKEPSLKDDESALPRPRGKGRPGKKRA